MASITVFVGILFIGIASAGLVVPDTTGIEPSQFPFVVSLRAFDAGSRKYKHICGGTIIGDQWIVTAANCLKERLSEIVAVAGTNGTLGNGPAYRVQQIILNSEFSLTKTESIADIALVQIHGKFEFNEKVQPISLANEASEPTGGPVFAAAWKYDSHSKLQAEFTQLLTVSNEYCTKRYGMQYGHEMQNSVICALGFHRGSGQVALMAGGPLIMNDKLVGVFSLGKYPSADKPSVFTRISSFSSWLQSKAGVKVL